MVPVRAILGIYARETGQGMIFPEGDADPDPTDAPPASPGKTPPELRPPSGRSSRSSSSAPLRNASASRGAKRVLYPGEHGGRRPAAPRTPMTSKRRGRCATAARRLQMK